MKRRLLKWLLVTVFFLPALLITTSAIETTEIASGYCGGEGDGTNLTWSVNSAGDLSITGNGKMQDYSAGSAPWYNKRGGITSVTMDTGITSIGNNAFTYLSYLMYVDLPSTLNQIGNYAFANCTSLEEIELPDGVTTIGSDAFENCRELVTVYMPDSVNSIENFAFMNCKKLANINLSSNLTSLGNYSFGRCQNLTNIALPNSLISIGSQAFLACSKLTEIIIPANVTSIGESAFRDCTSLLSVTFDGNAPSSVGKNIFYTWNNTPTVYYHEGTTGWTDSENYDTETETWYGYPLVMIPAPKMTITDIGRTISLEDEIYINQYVSVDGFDGIDVTKKGGLLIWNSATTEEEAIYGTEDILQEGLIAYKNQYTQRTTGIAAKHYADEVYLRVYVEVADGEFVYGPLIEYSVQDYCEHKISSDGYTADLKKTCAALLHYGTMAQRYFKYNTNDLANANILDAYPAPEWMKED